MKGEGPEGLWFPRRKPGRNGRLRAAGRRTGVQCEAGCGVCGALEVGCAGGTSSGDCAPNQPFRLFRCSAWLILHKRSTGALIPKRSCFRASPLRVRTELLLQESPVFRSAYFPETVHRTVSSKTLDLQGFAPPKGATFSLRRRILERSGGSLGARGTPHPALPRHLLLKEKAFGRSGGGLGARGIFSSWGWLEGRDYGVFFCT